MWIPNFLTSLRILAAALFPFVPSELRISVAVFSLITEFLDGKIARMFFWETPSGRILDPIADKLFALAVGITFVVERVFSWPEILFIIARDLLVAPSFLIALFFLQKREIVSGTYPNLFGKVTTVLQYAVFLWVLFVGRPPMWAIYFTGAWSTIAGIIYIVEFVKYLNKMPAEASHEKNPSPLL